MIFIDSNIPMYLIGADHPNKRLAIKLVEGMALRRERLVTDTEVYQEILHRYAAIARLDAIQPAFDVLSALVEEIFPVELTHVSRAKEILLGTRRISARDALHASIMEHHEVDSILTFDSGFDHLKQVTRIH